MSVSVLHLSKLIKREEELEISERMSSRMVRSASALSEGNFLGWQMYVPVTGLVEMSLFGSEEISEDDLRWISEKMAMPVESGDKSGAKSTHKKTSSKRDKQDKEKDELKELYELYLPVREKSSGGQLGFLSDIEESDSDENGNWPSKYSSQFAELVNVLRVTGAYFKVVLGPAQKEEAALCRKNFLSTVNPRQGGTEEYIGNPINTKFLLRLPGKPSVRLLTILREAVAGIGIRHLGSMEDEEIQKIWDKPLDEGVVLPDYASRIMIMEPDTNETVIGIEHAELPAEKIPAEHENTKSKKTITIGKAIGTNGIEREITIGEMDIRRHYEIVGQTGTGKSTLIENMVVSAIKNGFGLTFFDPHGSTIDYILKMVPAKYADKIRVVRIGDTENPVPLNIWESDDYEKEERNINDLCELMADIFDPKREGIVGPRYERWLSTFAKASIAFLGRRASLESIAVLSQSKDNMLKLGKVLVKNHRVLFETIKEEYGKDNSSEFQNMLGWYLCKFQRLTSVEQLRKTLGAGVDALNFKESIDTDTVTLIDLASPTIGTHAARIVGSLLLMKFWNAVMMRERRDMTHLVFVDEAALFQTNPMPRMLAESRKFGLGIVLCHQHEGQLTQEIRDALEANSANFSAFRLSPRDAEVAAIRFDERSIVSELTRQSAFSAITTLSVDGVQTAPFTLEIEKPVFAKNGEKTAKEIEQASIDKLVKPYEDMRALTAAEIQAILNHAEEYTPEEYIKIIRRKKSFFEEWQEKRKELEKKEKDKIDWLKYWNEHRYDR
jgi:Domain of unknown function DUF87.